MRQETSQKDYRSFEYKQVVVQEAQTSFCIDCYENFGWVLDERQSVRTERGQSLIPFRRDRRIANKAELTRLERHFSACLSELNELERSKTARPTLRACICGLFGAALLGGATLAGTAQPPCWWLCVALALPGFLGCLLPYFLYQRGVAKRTEKVTPFIDAKYEEIEEICKKGRSLL